MTSRITYLRAISIATVVTVAFLLTGCAAQPSATVRPSAAAVRLADERLADKPMPAHQGDVLRTDAKGRAQVDFPDGSLMRVGPASKVTITTLSAADVQRTRLTLDVGETWHRVKKLVKEDSKYEVVTPVGVASVHGTAFSVVCTPAKVCTVVVIEGEVRFAVKGGRTFTVKPYERLRVSGTQGALSVIPSDAVAADDWLNTNTGRDEVGGDVPAAATALTGTWELKITLTSSELDHKVGLEQTAVWTFSAPTCAEACTYAIASSSGLRWKGTTTTGGLEVTGTNPGSCGKVQNTAAIASTYRLAAPAAQSGAVSSLTGSLQQVFTPNARAAVCTGPYQGIDRYSVVLTR